MSRTPLLKRVAGIARVGNYCAEKGISAREALERIAEVRDRASRRGWTRRQALGALGIGALAAGLPLGRRTSLAAGQQSTSSARIAIIGAGMAGLACADRLERAGIVPVIYEAGRRVGGRVKTHRGLPQIAEAGGELIDNLHKTMLGFANELSLTREDYGKNAGEDLFYFDDALRTEEEVVDEYRLLVPRMRPDLQASSGAPTFFDHNDADVALDLLDLQSYLDTRAADLPLIRQVLAEAYVAEYGLECAEQSSLNMLLFLHLDRSANFREFGVFSDERYHIVEGNDQIAEGLADRLSATINTGATLTKLEQNASGGYALYFNGSTVPEHADAVVLTVPFSALRARVDLTGAGLSDDKRRAIQDLGYGNNCKTMVLFDGRPWADLAGSNGLVYSDLENVQNVWETHYTGAGATGLLTDYAGGDRGKRLQDLDATGFYCGSCHNQLGTDPTDIEGAVIQGQVDAFLTDLDTIVPGIKARAATQGGAYRAFRGHWLPQSTSRGSYTCYKPGQFTQIAGLEGEPSGLLKFAGEHANSFYEWQGFMEGACLSGIDAAEQLLRDIRDGAL